MADRTWLSVNQIINIFYFCPLSLLSGTIMAYHTHGYRDIEHLIPADVYVFREGDKAVAVDSRGRLIAENENHAEVINKGLEKGYCVVVMSGYYSLRTQDNPYNPSRPYCILIRDKRKLIGIGNVVFEADGNQLTVIDTEYNPDGSYKILNNVRIENIEIIANRTDSGYGIQLTGNGTIKNVVVHDVWEGIVMSYFSKVRILNCEVYNYNDYAINPHHGTNVIISNCYIHDRIGLSYNPNGIMLEGVKKGIVSNNIIEKALYGIVIQGHPDPGYDVQDIIIKDNIISDIDRHGIFINGTYNTTERIKILNNTIKNCGHNGINIYKSSHILIIGNHIENVAIATAGGGDQEGIRLYEAYKVKIVNNDIIDTQATPTMLRGIDCGADYSTSPATPKYSEIEIRGNRIEGFISTAIDFEGDYSTVKVLADDFVFGSLPSGWRKGIPIVYYDGVNYNLAVWDGSTWRMVALS